MLIIPKHCPVAVHLSVELAHVPGLVPSPAPPLTTHPKKN